MSTVAPPTTDLGVLLAISFSAFKDHLHAHLAAAGFDDLGSSYGYVFRALADAPLSLAQLAEQLRITPQGAHKVVSEMVDRGYIERQDDESDGRVRRLHLANRGKAALRAARRFHAQVEQELIKTLGPTKVAATRAVLEAMLLDGEDANAAERRTRPF